MSEESQSRRLGTPRRLCESEMELVGLLLQKAGDTGTLLNRMSSLDVREMSDGGMGSLYFVSETRSPEQRHMGQRIAEMQFNDADGVAILASLNVDKDGDLYELDVWKTDYTPVIRLSPNQPESKQ
jgi:hypothetical protein